MSDLTDKLRKLIANVTPGPWRWNMNKTSQSIQLEGGKPTFDKTVMDFVRWGMGRAAPRFNDEIDGNQFNIMERADRFGAVVPGRFAWRMADPKPLLTPIPFRGQQGFFDVPNEGLMP